MSFVECRNPHPDFIEEQTVGDGPNATVKQVPQLWCKRQKGHTGDCAAYAFSIRTPDTWPAP